MGITKRNPVSTTCNTKNKKSLYERKSKHWTNTVKHVSQAFSELYYFPTKSMLPLFCRKTHIKATTARPHWPNE